MPDLRASEVARVCHGTLAGDADAVARGFAADSRTISPGQGFVAVRGGHAHVGEALRAGAAFAVVDRADALPSDATGIVVEDTQRALASLAGHVRSMLDVTVVAVTGSTGKTITKDLIAAAAGAKFRVHATPGNYNNEVGLPLTVLGCPDDTQVLVTEVGARHPGEVASLTSLVRPRVGVVTGVGIAHLAEFGSRGAIARTKAELLAELPADGLAVVPSADDYLHVLADACPARVHTVGPGGTIRTVDGGVEVEGVVVPVVFPVPARHLLRNAGMAIAVARELGVDTQDAAAAVAEGRWTHWRMQTIRCGGRTILNDAYNANPTSLRAALLTLREMGGYRPAWAVLGEMAELGDAARVEHERMGRLAAALGLDRVIAVGPRAAAYAAGAGSIEVVDDHGEALDLLRRAPRDAVVLVKGSRAAGLEGLVSRLELVWAAADGSVRYVVQPATKTEGRLD